LLYTTIVGREELNIVRESHHSLAITKETYCDRQREPHTDRRHFNLVSEAALLQYTVSDNIDVERLWQIDLVYGTRPALTRVEYRFLSEQDAFRFQHLVTGYSPYRRFKGVSASALERHLFRRAKNINVSGEAQLWSCAPLEFGEEQPAGAEDLPDEGIDVTMAKPPLLVIFGKNATDGTYQIMRVDSKPTTVFVAFVLTSCCLANATRKVTNLKYRSSSSFRNKKTTFDLVSTLSGEFYVHMLSVSQVEFWNVCKLRPGVHSQWFTRHSCEVLTLRLGDEREVELFRKSLLVLQSLAPGARPPVLRSGEGSRTSSIISHPNLQDSSASTEEISDNPGRNSPVSTVEDPITPVETESHSNVAPGDPPMRPMGPVVERNNFNIASLAVEGAMTPLTGFSNHSIPASPTLSAQFAHFPRQFSLAAAAMNRHLQEPPRALER
jgi:hypothetical protein